MKSPVVIEDGIKRFQYMVSYSEQKSFMVPDKFVLMDPAKTTKLLGSDTCIISDTVDPLVDHGNFWRKDSLPVSSGQQFPEYVNTSTVRIDIPDYSPSTYSRSKYIVDISTRIGLKKIVLACKTFVSDDMLSLSEPYNDGMNKYHQCFSVDILDPWDLCYSDDYSHFRRTICGEMSGTNCCGSILDISISVVTESGDEYIPDNRYTKGRNLLLLGSDETDYMCLSMNDSADGWESRLEMNKSYGGDIKTYLKETYLLNVRYCLPEIIIMDKDAVYKIKELDTIDLETDPVIDTVTFSSSDKDLRFEDWSEYIDGLYAVSALRMTDENGLGVMDLKSNNVPIDKKKFSFIVGEEITLEDMDITVENLDVVNKIQKNVVRLNRPDDYKSNIVRPVFYKSYPLESIEIHDSVNFTISIDLDGYKTKSDSFSIQIENVNFPEIGRVPGGVLFRITGSDLPGENPEGRYYILDENQELVAEGKYTYV